MKKGWEYKKLGEVCRKSNNIKWDDVPNDASYRYIDLTSVDRSDLCIHNPQYIKKDNAPSRAKQIIKAGDIIFATTRPTLRRVSLIDEKYDGDICSTGFCVLRPNVDVKSKLIFYALLEDGFYKYIEPLQTGANYPAVTDNIVKNYIIPIPPLSEQQSIVDYLDSAFAKIDAMKANTEKALNEAKALFQASLKEMLEPKEGWEEKKLGEVGTFIRGGNFSKKDFVEDGYPCIHYGQIHTKFGVATYEHISCVPESIVKKERCASKGDLVIAITSEDDEGSCKCTAWMADFDAYVGGHTAIFKHSLNPLFVSYYFKAARFQKDKLNYTHGFKVVEISPKDIAKIPICYPPANEQQSIVTTLDSLKSKVDRLQANYEKISQECDALKQAILRQVFE